MRIRSLGGCTQVHRWQRQPREVGAEATSSPSEAAGSLCRDGGLSELTEPYALAGPPFYM